MGVNGEAPLTSEDSLHPSALAAMVQINKVNKETQIKGRWFNTEYNLKLSPNETGQIIIPSNTLFVKPLAPYSKLTRRNGKLYDPVNHTFIINSPVYVDIAVQLDIEDLPEAAAHYVMHKAAYDFYVNDDGDETKSNRLEMEVNRSWAVMQEEELRVSKLNAKDRPAAQQLRYRITQQYAPSNPNWPGGRG